MLPHRHHGFLRACLLAAAVLLAATVAGDTAEAQRLRRAWEKVKTVADGPLRRVKNFRKSKPESMRPKGREAGQKQKKPQNPRVQPKLKIAKNLNRTVKFKTLYRRAKLGRRILPAEASSHVYVLVGGIYTAAYPGYMRTTRKQLQERDLEVVRGDVNTFGGREENARRLEKQIRELTADGKKVVLIGHSKGGLDIVSTLALNPDLAVRVRATVVIQSPFQGFGDVPRREKAIGVVTGTTEALREVSSEGRRAFNQAHPYPTSIPTLSITSTVQKLGLLGPAAVYRGDRRKNTDGWVPEHAQYIPGTHGVQLKNLSHGHSVWKLPGKADYEPGPFIETAVALALKLPGH